MSTVRSNQLAVGHTGAAATWATIYEVPAGRTTIVKDLVLQNAHSGAVDSAFAIWADTSTYLASVARLDAHGAGKVERLERWTILEAGQLLRVYCSVANVLYYVVSGAELQGT